MKSPASGVFLALVMVQTLAPDALFADAHGALFIPTPRNAMDAVLPEYADGKSPGQGCTCTNGNPGGDSTTGCDRGVRGPGGDGQSCFWWSQGW